MLKLAQSETGGVKGRESHPSPPGISVNIFSTRSERLCGWQDWDGKWYEQCGPFGLLRMQSMDTTDPLTEEPLVGSAGKEAAAHPVYSHCY